MARYVSPQAQTPADELRRLLDASEKRAVSIRGAGAESTRELLSWLDRIAELFPELEEMGNILDPERGRWQTVQGAVRRHAGELLVELAPAGGLAAVRVRLEKAPAAATWWWYLDELRSQHRRRRLLIAIAGLAGVVVLFFAARWILPRLLPVDPAVQAAYSHQLQGEQDLRENQFDAAIQEFESARALTPDDPAVLLWLTALYDVSGRARESQETLDALATLTSPVAINAGLADHYVSLGQPQRAFDLAQQAIAQDPSYIQGYLSAGTAAESLGQRDDAIDYYNHAAELAFDQGNAELQVVARMQAAFALQSANIPTPITTPTP